MRAHENAVSACLLIGLVLMQLGEGARVQLTRVRKDTRDIPSDKFKPLQSSSPVGSNAASAKQDSNSEQNLYQQSTAEARFSTSFAPQEEPNTNTFGPRFPVPRRINFHQPGPSMNFHSSTFDTPFGAGHRLSGASNVGPMNLGTPGFRTTPFVGSNFPDFPRRTQTSTHISSSDGFFEDGHPLMLPGLGGSSTSNFHRSESFSFNSDGVGAPRIEQSLFDSRLGYGLASRNF